MRERIVLFLEFVVAVRLVVRVCVCVNRERSLGCEQQVTLETLIVSDDYVEEL